MAERPTAPQSPAKQKRRQEIVIAAKAIFFEEGFQSTSMDRIAELAGTTKRTIYDHFGSKEALFGEALELSTKLFVELVPKPEELPNDVREGLLKLIRTYAGLFSTPDSLRFQRMVISESLRMTDFKPAACDTAYESLLKNLIAFMELQIRSGRLQEHDCQPAARVFMSLATGIAHMLLLGIDDAKAFEECAETQEHAVDAYIARHRPTPH